MNSCLACQRGKRRCDRAQPSCSTCVRVKKACVYGQTLTGITRSAERSIAAPRSSGTHLSQTSSKRGATSHPPESFDPFERIASRQSAVQAALTAEAQRLIGPAHAILSTVESYFGTIHRQIPILSSSRFLSQIGSAKISHLPSETVALCLCMHMVQQLPTPNTESMTTSIYITVKGLITLLQATECRSIPFIQCMILVAYYEMCHGVLVSTSMTIAACARLAYDNGFHKVSGSRSDSGANTIENEGKRRAWWAIVNLDRYTNFARVNGFCSTPDMATFAPLPIVDDLWDQNIVSQAPSYLLSASFSPRMGIFARECQVIQLLWAVLQHVCEPTANDHPQIEEANRLENALLGVLPLEHGELEFERYHVALSIRASALFTLYTQSDEEGVQKKLEKLALGMTRCMMDAWENLETVQVVELSPYIIHCIYECAVVLGRLDEDDANRKAQWLRQLLEIFHRRWLIAGTYLGALGSERPSLIWFLSK